MHCSNWSLQIVNDSKNIINTRLSWVITKLLCVIRLIEPVDKGLHFAAALNCTVVAYLAVYSV